MMVTQEVSANPVATHYHHEGKLHELIITTRYDGNMLTDVGDTLEGVFAIDALDELTRATVRAWCQAWSMYKHHEFLDNPSPCVGLGIESSDSEPYCTVWNKDYNDLTITVQSSKPPVYAVIAALGQAQAIQAIHDSVKGAGAVKDKPDSNTRTRSRYAEMFPEVPDGQAQDTPWRGQEVSSQEAAFPNLVANAHDFSGWKHAIFQPDGTVMLPMQKKNQVRMGIRATQQIPYNNKDRQYEHEQIVVFPFGAIHRTSVGQNNIPVIDIITGGLGSIRVWCYKPGGDEEKTYAYDEIIKYFQRVGIDATADDFDVEYHALVAMQIAHAIDKDGNPVEYKNVYGFWNNPVQEK